MANLIPQGIDSTTGQNKPLTSTDALIDGAGNPIVAGLPDKYINGLQVLSDPNTSNTDILVDPGSCRDRDNTADITIASRVTIDSTLAHSASTGLPQANGIDEVGLDNLATGSITCSQSTTTITATGSIYSSTEGDGLYTPYDPTFSSVTMSTVGTAFTGGKEITRDVAVGDLVGNTSKGWSRVVSVDSETTLTLVAALPGGNATSESWSIIHNATIWPGVVVSDKQRINTLSASGTSITVGISKTLSAGSALTIGLLVRYPGDPERVWLAIWCTDTGSCYASTQHVSMLGISPETAKQRHIGWIPWNDDDKLQSVFYQNGGTIRKVQMDIPLSSIGITMQINYTSEPIGGSTTAAGLPRTAFYAICSIYLSEGNTAAGIASFRARNRGLGSGSAALKNRLDVNQNTQVSAMFDMPIDGAGYFDAREASGNLTCNVYCSGWVDDLGRSTPTVA